LLSGRRRSELRAVEVPRYVGSFGRFVFTQAYDGCACTAAGGRYAVCGGPRDLSYKASSWCAPAPRTSTLPRMCGLSQSCNLTICALSGPLFLASFSSLHTSLVEMHPTQLGECVLAGLAYCQAVLMSECRDIHYVPAVDVR
jgi:hypothetical protein